MDPNLFSPLKLRELTLKNRIVVSPMCQYSAKDGFANDWHFVHLGSFATGGASIIFTEAIAVSPEGRISPADLGIWSNEHIAPLRKITDFIHQNNAIAGVQLAHAGYKASTHEPWNGKGYIIPENGGWEIFSPSEHAITEDKFSTEISHEGIEKVVADFISATERALEAGFKVFEIHAAHGYLLNEFLSPLANKRIDEYGGSFENRIRLLLRVVAGVRAVIPASLPLFIRISASDWDENGWTIADSIKLAIILKELGVDVIDCSSGGLVSPEKILVGLGYQIPFSEAVRLQAGIKTGAVGLIVSPHQAEEVITSGKADLVFLAREMLRDPHFPFRAAYELGYDIQWPVQYERAKRIKKP